MALCFCDCLGDRSEQLGLHFGCQQTVRDIDDRLAAGRRHGDAKTANLAFVIAVTFAGIALNVPAIRIVAASPRPFQCERVASQCGTQ